VYKQFALDFGATHEEVAEALKFEGLEKYNDEIKQYYDGYATYNGDSLYNTWSMLNYLQKKEIRPYWIETGRTNLINAALWASDISTREIFENLLKWLTSTSKALLL